MTNRKQTFIRLRPEDFDARTLRRMAREGRLYFTAKPQVRTAAEPDGEETLIEYVSAISRCATPSYAHCITQIWQCIARDPKLNERLFIEKGRHQDELNRYRVMAIVTVLLEKNVYCKETYTVLQLHHILERTDKKDSIYTSRLNYAMSISERLYINKLLKKIDG